MIILNRCGQWSLKCVKGRERRSKHFQGSLQAKSNLIQQTSTEQIKQSLPHAPAGLHGFTLTRIECPSALKSAKVQEKRKTPGLSRIQVSTWKSRKVVTPPWPPRLSAHRQFGGQTVDTTSENDRPNWIYPQCPCKPLATGSPTIIRFWINLPFLCSSNCSSH